MAPQHHHFQDRIRVAWAERAAELRQMRMREVERKRQQQGELLAMLNAQVQEKQERLRKAEQKNAEFETQSRNVALQEMQRMQDLRELREREHEQQKQDWARELKAQMAQKQKQHQREEVEEAQLEARIHAQVMREAEMVDADKKREQWKEQFAQDLEMHRKARCEQRRREEMEEAKLDASIRAHVVREAERLEAEKRRERQNSELARELEEQMAAKREQRKREEMEEAQLEARIREHVAMEAERVAAERKFRQQVAEKAMRVPEKKEDDQWSHVVKGLPDTEHKSPEMVHDRVLQTKAGADYVQDKAPSMDGTKQRRDTTVGGCMELPFKSVFIAEPLWEQIRF